MNVGDTFHHATYGSKKHLHVVVYVSPEGHFLTVSVTSDRPGDLEQDRTCVIGPREHRVCTRRSVIAYNYAEYWDFPDLRLDLFEMDEPVSPELLLRIQRGALVTEQIKPRFQRMVRSLLPSSP